MSLGGLKRFSSVGLAGAVFVATYAGVFACSSTQTSYIGEPEEPGVRGAGFDTRPSAETGLGVLSFLPDTSFSGFDGAHTFTVPVAVYDSADDLEVTVDDPSAVEIVPKELADPV